MIDAREVVRDLTNWLDYTEPGWRTLEPGAKRELVARARRSFEEVARRHCIPDPDFLPPLSEAEQTILRRLAL